MTVRKPVQRAGVALPAVEPIALIAEVRALILQAREGVARAVDSALTTLFWHIGRRILQDFLKAKRAGYGEEIVSALRRQFAWTQFVSLIYLDDHCKYHTRGYIKIDVASPWTSA